MKLFSLFKPKHSRREEEYLAKVSAMFDPMLARVAPVIVEKARTWNLDNPVISFTLGYIAGFLDAAYQLGQPKIYDEALVDRIFIDVVERNLKWIPNSALFFQFSRLGLNSGGLIIGGMQDHPQFHQGRLVGGSDFGTFFNARREGRPSVPLGLMKFFAEEVEPVEGEPAPTREEGDDSPLPPGHPLRGLL